MSWKLVFTRLEKLGIPASREILGIEDSGISKLVLKGRNSRGSSRGISKFGKIGENEGVSCD